MKSGQSLVSRGCRHASLKWAMIADRTSSPCKSYVSCLSALCMYLESVWCPVGHILYIDLFHTYNAQKLSSPCQCLTSYAQSLCGYPGKAELLGIML